MKTFIDSGLKQVIAKTLLIITDLSQDEKCDFVSSKLSLIKTINKENWFSKRLIA